MDVRVTDNPDQQRYEAFADDGRLAGYVTYRLRPGLITLDHTEVDDEFEGEGVGSRLVSAVLDDARRRELVVHPVCPFVNSYIDRHREYVDLVPEAHRARFGL